MGKELKFFYDKEGDILDVSLGEPWEAISQEIEDDFFIRVVPDSNEVVGFSILNFEKWFKDKVEAKTIPISVQLQLVTK